MDTIVFVKTTDYLERPRPQPNHWIVTTKGTKDTKKSTSWSPQNTRNKQINASPPGRQYPKDSMIEQGVDHEWSKRLRRLGGCRRFARGKGCHAEVLNHRENLCEKTRKWTIVVRITQKASPPVPTVCKRIGYEQYHLDAKKCNGHWRLGGCSCHCVELFSMHNS